MCGIAGIFHYRHSAPVARHDLRRVTECLRHRGPDAGGYYIKGGLGLGHRRLSIIDLVTGDQPIFNEDRTVATVFNGEIYNFPELRRSLIEKGHAFYTLTDTEVIVHLYEDYGEDFAAHLRGMFAIALWDEPRRKLLLVRDRLGIKPLFYFLDAQKVVFGSEIKALLHYPAFQREVDFEALHDYLSFMTTRGSRTIFQGIHRLLPGEMLVCSHREVKKKAYWELEKVSERPSARMSAVELRELLVETVQSHLVSDVPVGAFLSGGIDSSCVVALASRLAGPPLKTFSIGFPDGKYFDESPHARRIAERFHTEHHEFMVTADLQDVIPKIVDHLDEPFAVSSALPMYFLSKLAREHVKVVLTGDGADELLAGYPYRYLALKHAWLFDRIPFLSRRGLEWVSRNRITGKIGKLDKIATGLHQPDPAKYLGYVGQFQETEKRALYSSEIREQLAHCDSGDELLRTLERYRHGDSINRWLYLDLKTSLPDEMLTKVDRMTMAFGLEARVPFLDHVLVERLCALPSTMKLRGLSSKYILRKALAGLLPDEVLKRRKHGFEVPVDEWLRNGLKAYTQEYLNDARIKKQGIFDWNKVSELLKLHWERRANLGHRIWTLLVFEIWHEKYC